MLSWKKNPGKSVFITTDKNKKQFVFFIFFVSGAISLIYEVAWLNRIQLNFGQTIYSLAITLGAFLSGLAIGAILSQKIIESKVNTFFCYAVFEILIGVYGLFFTPLLKGLIPIYDYVTRGSDISLLSISIWQFLFCLLIMLPPTILMGTTLPLLCAHITKNDLQHLSWNATSLYGLNTLGAFFGVLVAGNVLLPEFGYQNTIELCAFNNFLIVLLCGIYLEGSLQYSRIEIYNDLKTIFKKILYPSKFNRPKTNQEWSLLLCGLLSGFVSILVQILWNRLSSLNFGDSVYIFPIVTSLILLGIYFGTLIGQILLKRFNNIFGLNALYILLLASSLSLFIGNYLFAKVPYLMLWLHQVIHWNSFTFYLLQILITFIILLPASSLLGSLFPYCFGLYLQGEEKTSKDVGPFWAFNIFGVMAGVLLGTFIIFPIGGMDFFNKFITILPIFIMILLIPLMKKRLTYLILPIILMFSIMIKDFYKFDLVLLTGGYFYNHLNKSKIKKFDSWGVEDIFGYHKSYKSKLIAHVDDPHGLISIHEDWHDPNQRWFKVNGKVDGNNSLDDKQTTQLLALFPYLFKHDYETVLTIGLGTGETANMTYYFPNMKKSKIIEISPSMVSLAKKYFINESEHIWSDSRFSINIRDGRDYLRHSDEKYDLIISEPSNPWMNGVGSLFTLEFYQLVSKHLTKNGVASLWFHSYGIKCDAISSVFMAIAKVFKSVRAYHFNRDFFILVSNDPNRKWEILDIPFAQRHLEVELLRRLNPDVAVEGPLKSFSIFNQILYIKDRSEILTYDNYPLINTDDNQYLQFSTGKTYWKKFYCKKGFSDS